MLIHILLLIWYVALAAVVVTASSPSPSSPLILRIRKADGSMDRVVVPKDEIETTTLSSILSSFEDSDDDDDDDDDDNVKNTKYQIGTGNGPARQFVDVKNTNQPISSLNLKNGSIINIISTKPKNTNTNTNSNSNSNKTNNQEDESNTTTNSRYTAFDPFPDVAKSSHSAAARRSRALSRLPSKRSMSYAEIAKLRQHMHTIEPQVVGPITRIYMCALGAQRFKDSCTIMPTKKQLKAAAAAAAAAKDGSTVKTPEITHANKCAILFGSVNTERVDQSKRKTRTSLSTPLYEMEMCKVVKVHAVWEPSGQSTVGGKPYDGSKLWGIGSGSSSSSSSSSSSEKKKKKKEQGNEEEIQRALKIAESLGLKMVGWIYSYSEDRQATATKESSPTSDKEALPVFGRDVVIGAMGQIDNMERIGREEGCQFITLALDARTGATEAFQLSDTSVQMVAEGKVTIPEQNTRFFETKEPVLVDTAETSTLDSVFCLVNTAMLSHEGRFSGGNANTSLKKNGTLTMKAKKNILKHVDGDSEKLMSSLCDFNILMALDRSMGVEEMDELCNLVKKYSRGQRKTTMPSKKLKLMLKNILGG